MIPASAISNLQHSLTNRLVVARGMLDIWRETHPSEPGGARLDAVAALIGEVPSIASEFGATSVSNTRAASILHRLSGHIGIARVRVGHLRELEEPEETKRMLHEIEEQLAGAGRTVVDFKADWLNGSKRSLREAITRAAANGPSVGVSISQDPAFDDLIASRFVREFLDEALINAKKHGRPSITLQADCVDGEIAIRVRDDGPGFNRDDVKHGHGMHVLEASAAALGGEFLIESQPSAVVLKFPVEQHE